MKQLEHLESLLQRKKFVPNVLVTEQQVGKSIFKKGGRSDVSNNNRIYYASTV